MLNELISRHRTLMDEKAANKRALAVSEGEIHIADDIVSSAAAFLSKLKPISQKLLLKFPTFFVFSGERLYVKGEERTIPFDFNNALEIAQEAVKTINETLKAILSQGNDRKSLIRLGVALNTFYKIADTIKSLESSALEDARIAKDKREKKLNEEKWRIENDIEKLNADIVAYFSSLPKNPRRCPLEEAVEVSESRVYTHDIDLGVILESAVPEDFQEYVKKLGYEVDCYPHLKLFAEEGKNVAFLHAVPSFLKRNDDFKAKLQDLIYRSFLNFEPKAFKVALIEGAMGQMMLNPTTATIRRACADYIYSKDVADDARETADMITRLYEDVKNRNSKFFEDNGYPCYNIKDYNEHNRDNPFPYVFLVIKDFPSGFQNREIHEKLSYIMDNGATAGIMILLIGENEEIEVGYNNVLDPLFIPEQKYIEIDESKKMWLNGKPFALLDPVKDFDDVYLLGERYKRANAFSMENILEDRPKVPFYDEIAIPLGRAGSYPFSLISHTEKTPVPFTLVTGSTRTGKSAFMHLIILSGAYKYSPDELEFHVIDFKSAESSTEFAGYEKGQPMYIPHVKYLSLKSRPENALDIINYIQKLKSRRNRYGKFQHYNSKNPKEKMPMVYVIIDEYESMLSGGEANNGGDIDSITLKTAIKDGITKILKTAAVYGIGVIFSGQALRGFPMDAFAQLSTQIAFNNRANPDIFYTLFPGQKVDLSLFPEEDFRGMAFTANVNRPEPVFTKFAWAGTPETMAKMAQRIRDKYPEHSDSRQTIIGGTSSAELRLDSYLPWKKEIEFRLMEARSEYASDEEFENSKVSELITPARPIALGQSASSELTVYLDYSKLESARGFFALGRTQSLSVIERNAALCFLDQIVSDKPSEKHILILNGSKGDLKKAIFGSLLEKYPFLSDHIDYIDDKRKMAKTLLKLNKLSENSQKGTPYFLIMHELDWLNDKAALPSTEPKKPSGEDKAYDAQTLSAAQDSAKKLNNPMGSKMAAILGGAKFSMAQKKEEEVDEFKEYGKAQLKEAFRHLYIEGSLSGIFLLACSTRYESIRQEVLSLAKSDNALLKELENNSVYGSFDVMKSKQISTVSSASICYVLDGPSLRSTTRLFNYESDYCEPWWDRLKEKLK